MRQATASQLKSLIFFSAARPLTMYLATLDCASANGTS